MNRLKRRRLGEAHSEPDADFTLLVLSIALSYGRSILFAFRLSSDIPDSAILDAKTVPFNNSDDCSVVI